MFNTRSSWKKQVESHGRNIFKSCESCHGHKGSVGPIETLHKIPVGLDPWKYTRMNFIGLLQQQKEEKTKFERSENSLFVWYGVEISFSHGLPPSCPRLLWCYLATAYIQSEWGLLPLPAPGEAQLPGTSFSGTRVACSLFRSSFVFHTLALMNSWTLSTLGNRYILFNMLIIIMLSFPEF